MINARMLLIAPLVTLCALIGVLVLASAPALAVEVHVFTSTFGGSGPAAGELSSPAGVAVDSVTHDVYVADSGNFRVDEFSSSGSFIRAWGWGVEDGLPAFETCTLSCQAGISGSGAGQFTTPMFVAVDNSTGPSAGDVYVGDTGDNLVSKFDASGNLIASWGSGGQLDGSTATGGPFGSLDGITVTSSGTLMVINGSSRVFEFASDDSFITDFEVARGTAPDGLAVDSSGDFFKANGSPSIEGFTASGSDIGQVTSSESATGVAVDASTGELYVDEGTEIERYSFPSLGTVSQPDGSTCTLDTGSGCGPSETFGSSSGMSGATGIAVDPSNGSLYVADDTGNQIDVFTQVQLPDVISGETTGQVSEGSATFNGTVDPDGQAVTSCEFEYGTGASYGMTAACVPTPGSDSEPVKVDAAVSGLDPGTLYHYRLVAGNANGTNPGADRTFDAFEHPVISEEGAGDIASSSAHLSAQVDPGGSETTYRFEYGPTASYGTSVPVPDENIGAGLEDVEVSLQLQGLQPHTAYHWRVVAGNEIEREVDGPDQIFTTQTAGGPIVLPDNREWEMVSPAQKQGSQTIPAREAVIQAAEDGDAITYYTTGPFVSEAPGNVGFSQALSRRSASGWSTDDIAPSHQLPDIPNNNSTQSEEVFFSANLADGLVEPSSGRAPATERNVYERNEESGVYEPLLTASNISPGTKLTGEVADVELVTATPDLDGVVLGSNENLNSQGTTESILGSGRVANDYEWVDGQLQFINVLPADTPEQYREATEVFIGSGERKGGNMRHAISDDGSRVFWATAGQSQLYMRDTKTGESVRISKAEAGVAEPTTDYSATFQFANSDGSEVFFTDSNQLTHVLGGGLYVYDVESGKLTLLTVPENTGEEGGIEGMVVGGSEDGSYIYFVSSDVLSGGENEHGEKAEAGDNNLYVIHGDSQGGTTEWKASFITALSEDDKPDWGDKAGSRFDEPYLDKLTARVSPDGQHLVFMSDMSLTGYDNVDVNSGQHDEEVFSFDVQSGRLVCASCNPTGARPLGHQHTTGVEESPSDLNAAWYERWLAASVPEWVASDGHSALYQPRYLSDSGRLFFNSSDALVPQDTNGTEDVYEYEPEGVGSCTSSSATYSEKSAGCMSLISGGTGEQESVFADASVNGNDAFFATSERLVGSDIDKAYDMYDARVCSDESPCLPPEVAGPPACETADSCKAAPTPQPSVFGSPASATFAGAGNISPPASKTRSKKRSRVKKLKKKAAARKHLKKRTKRHTAKRARKGISRSYENANEWSVR